MTHASFLAVAFIAASLATPSRSLAEVRLSGYTTGYSYFDNTPPGTAILAFAKKDGAPTLHDEAGGIGTYEDPITLAVGHSITEGVSTPDFPPGTRFYIPNVRRYFIVEDVCGDGDRPQDGPCHKGSPKGTNVWVDLWIGGHDGTKQKTDACMSKLTDTNGVMHILIKDPSIDYVVVPEPLFQNGRCSEQYGNDAIKK